MFKPQWVAKCVQGILTKTTTSGDAGKKSELFQGLATILGPTSADGGAYAQALLEAATIFEAHRNYLRCNLLGDDQGAQRYEQARDQGLQRLGL